MNIWMKLALAALGGAGATVVVYETKHGVRRRKAKKDNKPAATAPAPKPEEKPAAPAPKPEEKPAEQPAEPAPAEEKKDEGNKPAEPAK